MMKMNYNGMKLTDKMKMNSRKAEIQLTETIFIVFFILVIILLGFVFFAKFQEIGLKEQERLHRNTQVIELAHRISFWPELECSIAGSEGFACLDLGKLNVFSDFINQSAKQNNYAFNYYYDLLKNAKISISEIYPSNSMTPGEDYWVIYDNPGSTSTADPVIIPVNLYDPFTKKYLFGVMEVLVYK